MNIEDIKLELVALQKLDTQNAINYGAKSKSDWFKQIITNEDNDVIAESIIEKAGEADVPVYADSKLADTLSKLEIGEMIPPELYTVVAEILVFVDECDKIKGKVGK